MQFESYLGDRAGTGLASYGPRDHDSENHVVEVAPDVAAFWGVYRRNHLGEAVFFADALNESSAHAVATLLASRPDPETVAYIAIGAANWFDRAICSVHRGRIASMREIVEYAPTLDALATGRALGGCFEYDVAEAFGAWGAEQLAQNGSIDPVAAVAKARELIDAIADEKPAPVSTGLRYSTTNDPCGPDVQRLSDVIVEMLYGPESERGEAFGPSIIETRKEIAAVDPEHITWETVSTVGADFNIGLKAFLDEVVSHGCHPSVGDAQVETHDLLTGRIGSLAIRCELSIYANGEEGSLSGFRAVQCETLVYARLQALAWAAEDTLEYAKDSMEIAASIAKQIDGVDLRALRYKMRELATTSFPE